MERPSVQSAVTHQQHTTAAEGHVLSYNWYLCVTHRRLCCNNWYCTYNYDAGIPVDVIMSDLPLLHGPPLLRTPDTAVSNKENVNNFDSGIGSSQLTVLRPPLQAYRGSNSYGSQLWLILTIIHNLHLHRTSDWQNTVAHVVLYLINTYYTEAKQALKRQRESARYEQDKQRILQSLRDKRRRAKSTVVITTIEQKQSHTGDASYMKHCISNLWFPNWQSLNVSLANEDCDWLHTNDTYRIQNSRRRMSPDNILTAPSCGHNPIDTYNGALIDYCLVHTFNCRS